MNKIITWTGWSKDDWKDFGETVLSSVGLIGSLFAIFLYF